MAIAALVWSGCEMAAMRVTAMMMEVEAVVGIVLVASVMME